MSSLAIKHGAINLDQDFVKEAAIQAIKDGKNQYARGRAILKKYRTYRGRYHYLGVHRSNRSDHARVINPGDKGKTLSAALMSDANFDGADMLEVVMSKAYAVGASFKGVNFSIAVLDRVNFEADLLGASFKNVRIHFW